MSEEQIMLKLEMYLVSLYHNKSIICMQRNFSNRPTNLRVKKNPMMLPTFPLYSGSESQAKIVIMTPLYRIVDYSVNSNLWYLIFWLSSLYMTTGWVDMEWPCCVFIAVKILHVFTLSTCERPECEMYPH